MNQPLKITLGGIVAAVVLLIIAVIGDQIGLPYNWESILYILPILPLILVGYGTARGISNLDELQQRIHIEALAFSLANTVFICAFVGLMQVRGSIEINLFWVVPIASGFWALGLLMARRKYL